MNIPDLDTLKAWCYWVSKNPLDEDQESLAKVVNDVISQMGTWKAKAEKLAQLVESKDRALSALEQKLLTSEARVKELEGEAGAGWGSVAEDRLKGIQELEAIVSDRTKDVTHLTERVENLSKENAMHREVSQRRGLENARLREALEVIEGCGCVCGGDERSPQEVASAALAPSRQETQACTHESFSHGRKGRMYCIHCGKDEEAIQETQTVAAGAGDQVEPDKQNQCESRPAAASPTQTACALEEWVERNATQLGADLADHMAVYCDDFDSESRAEIVRACLISVRQWAEARQAPTASEPERSETYYIAYNTGYRHGQEAAAESRPERKDD